MGGVSREGTRSSTSGSSAPSRCRGRERGSRSAVPSRAALLAALALEPAASSPSTSWSRILWPGEPPDTAAHAVQVYVSQLRKTLGTETIATRAPGYVLEVDP